MWFFEKDMRYNLKNKTIVLTGASSGIGREMAKMLICDYGCTVYGIARRGEFLYELRDKLGDGLVPYPFDVSIKENWQSLAKFLDENEISVDMLINCAGVLPKFASADKVSSDEVMNTMNVNFLAQLYATEALLPNIKKSTQGAIISFSSSSALCPFAGVSAYCASKSASRAYFECMTRENKQLYIATVMNGFVKTDIMKNQEANEKESRLISRVSLSLKGATRKIIRKIKKGKRRIIVGKDAHLMNFMYKLFPNSAPRLISWLLKRTKLEIFKDI